MNFKATLLTAILVLATFSSFCVADDFSEPYLVDEELVYYAPWISEATLYLLRAEKLNNKNIVMDDDCNLDCMRSLLNNRRKNIIAEYRKAIEAEPLDWRAWAGLAHTEDSLDGSTAVARSAYDKALSLMDRCDGRVNSVCPKIKAGDHDRIRFAGARLHLSSAHYERAAELYTVGLKNLKLDEAAQWGAVARFAAQDLKAARTQYRETAKSSEQFVAKGALETMLRIAFIKLSDESEEKGRLWDAYAHEQNVARIEAAADSRYGLFQPKPYTTDKLIELYNKLAGGGNGVWISPAMSTYADAHAEAAQKYARSGDYYKARRSYRLALATDPWWADGIAQLAEVELMFIGLCNAIPTAKKALNRLIRVPHETNVGINIGFQLRKKLRRWQEQYDYAWRNGSVADEPGYCDPDPDMPRRSMVVPDQEVLVAPE